MKKITKLLLLGMMSILLFGCTEEPLDEMNTKNIRYTSSWIVKE